jgi:hypothetical protein
MRYTKPEILMLAQAVGAIQGSPKNIQALDSNHTKPTSVSAYEADE